MNPSPSPDQIRTVSELTSQIKRLLEGAVPPSWVKGEISNLRYQSSGHIYLTLKDAGAQISAVMFRGDASRLRLRLKEGMEVLALGNLSVYEPRGSYQLIIRDCVEEGAGRLQAEFERLKKLLQSEGLFDAARKQALPLLPRTVGIITSPTGAALRDFVSILKRRKWMGRIVLFPATVQGSEGAADIVDKLKWAESYGELDLLVIGRGGGSVEDLWNFNEESVVRAVASCAIPIVSAVGHEIDFVLTDFAADQRAETPSAAAELISSGYLEIQQRLQQSTLALRRQLAVGMRQHLQRLQHNRERLRGVTPSRMLENRHLRLDELQQRMGSRLSSAMHRYRHETHLAAERLKNLHPSRQFLQRRDQFTSLQLRLSREVRHQMDRRAQQMRGLEKRLEGLGVDNVLRRGFAVVRDFKGKVMTHAGSLKHQQRITLQMQDGVRKAQIDSSEQLDFFLGHESRGKPDPQGPTNT